VNVPLAVEREVVQGARSGGAGLERLITAVWPEAYRIALSILRDGGLAEDAAQEACARIARSLNELKNDDSFRAWSYRVIVNQAITVARHRPRTQGLDALVHQVVHFDQSDTLDLYNALAELSPVQRGVIISHYYAGLNSGEISAATGLPRSTVRFHLMLARRALRKALSSTDPRARSSTEALSDVH
jgi:RNA polymerase sigma-70 factor (ECF subfamily)